LGQQVGLPFLFFIKRIGMIRREFPLPRFPSALLACKQLMMLAPFLISKTFDDVSRFLIEQ
jgi:hypothetical protein